MEVSVCYRLFLWYTSTRVEGSEVLWRGYTPVIFLKQHYHDGVGVRVFLKKINVESIA